MSASKHPDSKRITVGLVDDHPMVLAGLEQVLSRLDLEVVFAVACAEDALFKLADGAPDLIITDLNLPRLSGTTWLAALGAAAPKSKIMVFTMADDVVSARQALATGATGYLLKGAKPDVIRSTVKAVLRGRVVVDPEVPTDDLTSAEALSPREWEVLRELVRRRRTREIAEVLGISPKTAENHRSNISNKLGSRHVSELVRFGINQGLLRSE